MIEGVRKLCALGFYKKYALDDNPPIGTFEHDFFDHLLGPVDQLPELVAEGQQGFIPPTLAGEQYATLNAACRRFAYEAKVHGRATDDAAIFASHVGIIIQSAKKMLDGYGAQVTLAELNAFARKAVDWWLSYERLETLYH